MSERKLCYVISVIGAPGSRERKHADLAYHYIIKPALKDFDYTLRRADEEVRPGMITVNLINALTEAHLVIADLTFLNPNVFYELGLRHSTRRSTIHLASEDTKLPFDNSDHSTIFYDIGDWSSHRRTVKTIRTCLRGMDDWTVTNPFTVAETHRNDARLTRVIERVSELVEQLEERVSRVTEMPPPGHVTRDDFKRITEKHRSDIQEIVAALRQKINQRAADPAASPAPKVSDVLRRLDVIEEIIHSHGWAPNAPSSTTTQ